MKRINEYLKSIFVITLVIKVLGLLYKMILTRILKIDGMIVYSLLTPALSLSICLSSYNIQIVCNQNVSENSVKPIRNILKSAAKINIVTSSIVSLAILLAFPFLKKIYNSPYIYYPLLTIIPLIFFSNFSGIMKGYLEAKKDFTTPGISNLFEQISKIILSILFLYIAKNENIYTKVFLAFLAMSLSEITSFTYLIFKLKERTKFNWFETCDNQKINILKQATPLTIEHFVISISSFIEPLLFFSIAFKIGYSKADATLMYTLCYEYAIPLLIIAAFISTTLGKTLFPYVAESKQNLSNIKKRIDNSLIITLAVSIINFNICFFHTDFALDFLYSDNQAKKIVKLLAVFYYFSYYSPIFISILQASKSELHLLKESIFINLLSLLLTNFLMIFKNINLYSLPISIGISSIIKNVINYLYIHKNLKYRIKASFFVLLFVVLIQNIVIFNCFKLNQTFNLLFANLISLTLIAFYYFWNNNKLFSHQTKHK